MNGQIDTLCIYGFFEVINRQTEHCLDKREEEMLQSPQRREDMRLSWEGESDRSCHLHIARGPELTGLVRMWWEDKDQERRKKALDKQLGLQLDN